MDDLPTLSPDDLVRRCGGRRRDVIAVFASFDEPLTRAALSHWFRKTGAVPAQRVRQLRRNRPDILEGL
jgi:hypothetical protein